VAEYYRALSAGAAALSLGAALYTIFNLPFGQYDSDSLELVEAWEQVYTIFNLPFGQYDSDSLELVEASIAPPNVCVNAISKSPFSHALAKLP
jgi:hypothetical protein